MRNILRGIVFILPVSLQAGTIFCSGGAQPDCVEKSVTGILFIGQDTAWKDRLVDLFYNQLLGLSYNASRTIVGDSSSSVGKYQVVTDDEVVMLINPPALSGDFEEDRQTIDLIGESIYDASLNAIIVAINEHRDVENFEAALNNVKLFFPKSLLSYIIGFYMNGRVVLDLDEHQALNRKFAHLFGIPEGNRRPVVAFGVDGQLIPGKFDPKISDSKQRLGAVRWKLDAEIFSEAFQEIRGKRATEGYQVADLKYVFDQFKEKHAALRETYAAIRLLEDELKLLRQSLAYQQHRKDSNSNYEVKYDRNNLPKCPYGSVCAFFDHVDECKRKEHNAAVEAINLLTNQMNETLFGIEVLQNKAKEITDEIAEVQSQWEDLAMTTDLTPMIRQVEKKMRAIDSNVMKTKEEKAAELSVLKQIKELYFKMMDKTPDL